MSALIQPEKSDKSDVFHHIRPRLFTSVLGGICGPFPFPRGARSPHMTAPDRNVRDALSD